MSKLELWECQQTVRTHSWLREQVYTAGCLLLTETWIFTSSSLQQPPEPLSSLNASSTWLCCSFWGHSFSAPRPLFCLFACFFFSRVFLPWPSFSSHPSSPSFLFPQSWTPEGKGLQVRQPPLRLSVADIKNINLEWHPNCILEIN